jgi:ribose transport system substrate-binding protein
VPSQETAISRARGFDEVVTSRFGRWRIIRKTADWNRQQGRLAVDAVLSTEGVPAGVFACNDEMALGAVAALEAYGAKPRSPEWPVIVGFDATNEALDAIRKDTVRGTIAQQPDKMGYEAVRLAAQLVRGESVQRDHLIPVKLIDERK